MQPLRISASSIESFEGCPARFESEMVVTAADGVKSRINTDSAPGRFGTALHAALDRYFEYLESMEWHHDHAVLLHRIWPAVANEAFGLDESWTQQGEELLEKWISTRPLPHKVLSREVKETFDLVVPGYDTVQPVTYICDRIDEREDGSIEVIDYKSQYLNVSSTAMSSLVQPGLYACAMRRKYGVEKVHVTYDMLRYAPVTVTFDATMLNRVEAYLGQVAARIRESDGTLEKLNSKCQYCPRKAVCRTLLHAHETGWTPSLPLASLIYIRDNAKGAMKGLEALMAEIDNVVLERMEHDDVDVLAVGNFKAHATTKRITTYNPEIVLRVLGPEALQYMKVGKSALDRELKRRTGMFTREQREEIARTEQVSYGEPKVDVEKVVIPDAG